MNQLYYKVLAYNLSSKSKQVTINPLSLLHAAFNLTQQYLPVFNLPLQQI